MHGLNYARGALTFFFMYTRLCMGHGVQNACFLCKLIIYTCGLSKNYTDEGVLFEGESFKCKQKSMVYGMCICALCCVTKKKTLTQKTWNDDVFWFQH